MRFRVKWMTALLIVSVMILNLAVPASASLDPDVIDVILHPGDELVEEKCLEVDVPPLIDIVFAFDLTGSMMGVIGTAQDRAGVVMEALALAYPDAEFNFGVMSYMDYNGYYSSCDYTNMLYGSGDDYPYMLDQAITDDTVAVSDAIEALVLGYGGDGPQDYTRIFYESYADPNVGWREGAKRILINFGDNVPHDCDLNEGVPGTFGTWSTGADPGRNNVIDFGGDDLDLQTVLAEMAAEGIILLEGQSYLYYGSYWAYWTGITGGAVFDTTSGDFVNNIVGEVGDALAEMEIVNLHLEALAYETWFTSEWYYTGPVPEEPLCEIDVLIQVPDDAEPGVYVIPVIAVDDFGVVYGEQTIIIRIPGDLLIDVKPMSDPNSINLNKDNGVLPVAILTEGAFDATSIDPATVELTDGPFSGFTGAVAPVRWMMEDVDEDGDMDLIFQFDMMDIREQLVIEPGDEEVWLLGHTFDGAPFEGMDSIRIVGGNPH